MVAVEGEYRGDGALMSVIILLLLIWDVWK